MKVDLKPDGCKMSLFWEEWIKGGESAVIDLTQFKDFSGYFKSIYATKRNDYRKSVKRGYASRKIGWCERNTLLDEIYEIHTSKEKRQGREMSEAYKKKVKPVGEFLCQEHSGRFFGCFNEFNTLVAYIMVSQMGEIWFLSMIIGHGDHLKNLVMVNVLMSVIEETYKKGIKYIGYHRWNNGTKGLQFWKKSLGFKPIQLEI